MDPVTLIKAIAIAWGAALAVLLLAAILLRKLPPGPFHLAAGALAAVIGFLSAQAFFFGPRVFIPAEAWQMTGIDSALIALAIAVAFLLPRRIASFPFGVLIAVVAFLTVRDKLTPRQTFLLSLAAAQLLYLIHFRLAARLPTHWLISPLNLLPATAASAILTLAYIDANTGRLLMLLSALSGIFLAASLIPKLRPLTRGTFPFLALASAPLLAFAAYYNFSLPLSVFILLALAPAAPIITLPFYKRPLLSLTLTIITTAALLTPAIILAVKNAPAFE